MPEQQEATQYPQPRQPCHEIGYHVSNQAILGDRREFLGGHKCQEENAKNLGKAGTVVESSGIYRQDLAWNGDAALCRSGRLADRGTDEIVYRAVLRTAMKA
jgi:hypothetical protein